MEKKVTLYDLLVSMREREREKVSSLPNNRETWSRIARKDDFPELGLSGMELETFLEEWIANNPYSNI